MLIMKNPKISVITVSFNAEKTIEITIKSLLSQKFKDYEYLIIDGNSSDTTLKIVRKYKSKIKKIISKKDKGIYDAMNKGVNLANGEFIYFLNADDVLKDNEVLKNISNYLNDINDLVFGDIEFSYPFESKNVRISRSASINDLRNGNMPPHQGSFIRKKWLIKNPFSLNYKSSSDFDFFCNMLKQKPKIKKVNKVIAVMQIGGVSAGKISYKETEMIVKKHFGFFSYILLKTKHTIFSFIKKVLNLIGVRVHKG